VPSLEIFFHDNCFDGATSAALFTDFYRRHIDADADVRYVGMQHSAGDPFEGVALDAEDNACVDFRYTASEHLTWWFDHHVSAFQPAELRAHFDADRSGQKFFDPTVKSCAKFIVDTLTREFGYELPAGFAEFVRWAHVIDSAAFASAADAVDLSPPHMQLMTWLEHNEDAERTHELIRSMGRDSLAELCRKDWIHEPLQPLLEQHQRNIELVRSRALCVSGVVSYDVVSAGDSAPNKFISYYLFPDARYTVALSRIKIGLKVSVGYNPWCGKPREHNIAELCEPYGGGGHPVVGAITFPEHDLDHMQRAFDEICALLRGG